jgi:hypothetical protein
MMNKFASFSVGLAWFGCGLLFGWIIISRPAPAAQEDPPGKALVSAEYYDASDGLSFRMTMTPEKLDENLARFWDVASACDEQNWRNVVTADPSGAKRDNSFSGEVVFTVTPSTDTSFRYATSLLETARKILMEKTTASGRYAPVDQQIKLVGTFKLHWIKEVNKK